MTTFLDAVAEQVRSYENELAEEAAAREKADADAVAAARDIAEERSAFARTASETSQRASELLAENAASLTRIEAINDSPWRRFVEPIAGLFSDENSRSKLASNVRFNAKLVDNLGKQLSQQQLVTEANIQASMAAAVVPATQAAAEAADVAAAEKVMAMPGKTAAAFKSRADLAGLKLDAMPKADFANVVAGEEYTEADIRDANLRRYLADATQAQTEAQMKVHSQQATDLMVAYAPLSALTDWLKKLTEANTTSLTLPNGSVITLAQVQKARAAAVTASADAQVALAQSEAATAASVDYSAQLSRAAGIPMTDATTPSAALMALANNPDTTPETKTAAQTALQTLSAAAKLPSTDPVGAELQQKAAEQMQLLVNAQVTQRVESAGTPAAKAAIPDYVKHGTITSVPIAAALVAETLTLPTAHAPNMPPAWQDTLNSLMAAAVPKAEVSTSGKVDVTKLQAAMQTANKSPEELATAVVSDTEAITTARQTLLNSVSNNAYTAAIKSLPNTDLQTAWLGNQYAKSDGSANLTQLYADIASGRYANVTMANFRAQLEKAIGPTVDKTFNVASQPDGMYMSALMRILYGKAPDAARGVVLHSFAQQRWLALEELTRTQQTEAAQAAAYQQSLKQQRGAGMPGVGMK